MSKNKSKKCITKFNKVLLEYVAKRSVVALDTVLSDAAGDVYLTEPVRIDISFYPSFTDEKYANPSAEVHVQSKDADLRFPLSYYDVQEIRYWLENGDEEEDE